MARNGDQNGEDGESVLKRKTLSTKNEGDERKERTQSDNHRNERDAETIGVGRPPRVGDENVRVELPTAPRAAVAG